MPVKSSLKGATGRDEDTSCGTRRGAPHISRGSTGHMRPSCARGVDAEEKGKISML